MCNYKQTLDMLLMTKATDITDQHLRYRKKKLHRHAYNDRNSTGSAAWVGHFGQILVGLHKLRQHVHTI